MTGNSAEKAKAQSYTYITVGLLVLVAFALRLWRIDVQDIWWDEARNIDVALRPLAAIPRAPELDIHPPGYFILLHAWLKVAGHSAFATRFFSAWFGVLLIPLLIALARRLRIPRAGEFAALYAALSPFLIGEAQETRMYTLAFALLTLVALFFWETWRGRPRAWTGLGVSMAAAVLTHYSTVFVLLALYVFGVFDVGYRAWREHREEEGMATFLRGIRPFVLAGLLALVLFLPQAPRAYEQIAPYGNPNLDVPSPAAYARQLWHAYTVGIPLEGPWALGGMAAFLGALLGLVFWAWPPFAHHPAAPARSKPSAICYLLSAILLPIASYYLVLIRRATFAPRYISFVVPFLALVIGLALTGWWRRQRLLALFWVGILVAFLGLGIHADQFNPRYFREDTSGLARWLMQNTTADDLVLIDVPYPLGFYYPRYSRNPDLPPPDAPDHIAPAYYLFVDIRHVGERLTALAAGKRRIFWVQWFKSDTDPRGVVTYLLRKYGVHAGHAAFRGYTVDWYRVPPHVRYEVTAGPPRAENIAQFGEDVFLARGWWGHSPAPDIHPVPETPRPVWVALTWQRMGRPAAGYKASVRLLDPLGRVVAQDDRRILSDRHLALPYWDDNERADNVYLIDLPLGTPPGTYTLTVRVYDPATLNPLPAVSKARVLTGTDVVLGTVEITHAAAFPTVTPTALTDAPISLVEGRVAREEAAPGTVVPVQLLWVKQRRDAGEPFRARLSLLDAAGHVLSPWETPLVPWSYPTTEWAVGEVVRGDLPWRLAAETPSGEYRVRLALLDKDGRSLGEVDLGPLKVAGRAHHFRVPPMQHTLETPSQFGNLALLLGYDVSGDIRPGASLVVTLTWKALGPSEVSYTGFVQLLDETNRVIAQEDHVPQRGAAPTTSWVEGEIVQDRYDLRLPETLPSGPYRLITGLYDATTMQRVKRPDGSDHLVLMMWERK